MYNVFALCYLAIKIKVKKTRFNKQEGVRSQDILVRDYIFVHSQQRNEKTDSNSKSARWLAFFS